MMNYQKITRLICIALVSLWGYSAIAQNSVLLRGKVVSNQSAATPVRSATINFYGPDNQLLDDCSSNSRGEFISTVRVAVNQEVTIEVVCAGFESFRKVYNIRTGDFGTIRLEPLRELRGVISSDEGKPIDGAIITVYEDINYEKSIGTPVNSDNKGQYRTEKILKSGKTVYIKVKRIGFEETDKTIKVTGENEIKMDFILNRRIFISGQVIDSVTRQPVVGADVSFPSKEGQRIKPVKTNQDGYYEFSAPFVPGEVIQIKVELNPLYAPIEEKMSIVKHEIAPSRLDFDLPKWEDRGLKVGFRVYNSKGKPLSNVNIIYFDRKQRNEITGENGEAIAGVYGKIPGQKIEFRFSRPKYKERKINHTLLKDFEYVDIYLEKTRSRCNCWLWTGVGLGVVSLSGFTGEYIKYQDHKGIKNLSRDADYQDVKTLAYTGYISGGLSVSAFVGYFVCRKKEKEDEERAIKRPVRPRVGWLPYTPGGGNAQIGFTYALTSN